MEQRIGNLFPHLLIEIRHYITFLTDLDVPILHCTILHKTILEILR